MAFDREQETFRAHLTELLPYEGKWVVIQGEAWDAPHETYEAALEAGYERFGLTQFMVKKIQPSEPIQYFSRDLPRCPS